MEKDFGKKAMEILINMKGRLLTTKNKDKEYILGKMEISTKDHFKKI